MTSASDPTTSTATAPRGSGAMDRRGAPCARRGGACGPAGARPAGQVPLHLAAGPQRARYATDARDAGGPPNRAVPIEYPGRRAMADDRAAERTPLDRNAPRDPARPTIWPHSPGPATPCAPRKWSPDPLRQQENRAAARFVKPSAGLEPATPSLPWRSRHRWEPSCGRGKRCVAADRVALAGRSDRHISTPPVPTGYPAADGRSARWSDRDERKDSSPDRRGQQLNGLAERRTRHDRGEMI